MSAKPVVLKLGGSVITRKEKPLTPNLPAMRRLAFEISKAAVSRLVLVHGGGSFGHPLAKRYSLEKGFRDSSQLLGFSKTHQAMVVLNRMVVDALIQRNIPAVGLQPSSCAVSKSGRIHTMEDEPLRRLLESGFVPVLYGDTVVDLDMGFSILSGDQLVAHLAVLLNANRVIVGIDEDGLYSCDPKVDPSARLISHATPQELKNMREGLEKAKTPDVTGGMLGKIAELMPAVERGVSALIVNAAKANNVYRALKGESVVGTLIEKE